MDRLLENWDPLKEFFYEEVTALKKKSSSSSYAICKAKAILDFVRSPTNRLYCLFLRHTLKVFDPYLTTYQAEAPLVHKLRRGMATLLRNLFSRFVKPSALLYKSTREVDYKTSYNLKGDGEVDIGEAARDFLEEKDEHHLKDERITEFFISAKKYFKSVAEYLLTRLPLDSEMLQHAEVADVSLQVQSKMESLRWFLKKFPALLPPGTSSGLISEQFAVYQGTDVSMCLKAESEKDAENGKKGGGKGESGKKDKEEVRLDEVWRRIGEVEEGTFRELSLVMRGMLSLPHSSAHCERIFSCVRKNKTPQRESMSDETLGSLLILKSSGKPPVEAVQKLNSAQLKELKSAYYLSSKKKC